MRITAIIRFKKPDIQYRKKRPDYWALLTVKLNIILFFVNPIWLFVQTFVAPWKNNSICIIQSCQMFRFQRSYWGRICILLLYVGRRFRLWTTNHSIEYRLLTLTWCFSMVNYFKCLTLFVKSGGVSKYT